MISIQVSVQQHTATALPSMIHAHIKLGRSNISSPPMSNTPLIDLISAEPMGKIPLVEPSFPTLALEKSLLMLAGLKRPLYIDNDLPPFKKARVLDFPAVCPQSPPSPVKSKVLRFADSEQAEVIPDSPHDYDCEARWYSRSEYNAFREDMKMNFFMHSMYMNRNTLSQKEYDVQVCPPKDMCIRGLEKFCFFSNHEAVVKDARKLRIQAVLDQQSVQRALGYEDTMAIRVVAELYSQKFVLQALERAAEDYRAVLYGWSRKSI